MENILNNIVEIRKKQGLSQEDLSDKISLDVSNYSKLERGISSLTIEKLAKIAKVFEMDLIDVITYPKKYVDKDSLPDEKIKASLTIEFDQDKKDQVMKLVFGKNSLEILNK